MKRAKLIHLTIFNNIHRHIFPGYLTWMNQPWVFNLDEQTLVLHLDELTLGLHLDELTLGLHLDEPTLGIKSG